MTAGPQIDGVGLDLHADAGMPRSPAGPASPIVRLDRQLGRIVDVCAGALVLADIVVLLAGVVARFVFHRPLVWSDELASMLFIWLAMLGAVIALRRGEHMRMTGIVNRASRMSQEPSVSQALCASIRPENRSIPSNR